MYNINAYVTNSESVSNLQTDPLFVRILKGERVTVRTPNIINWGCHHLPRLLENIPYKWANHPTVTALLSDKRALHYFVSEPRHNLSHRFIETTTDPVIALEWLQENKSVVCRQLTRASNGRGMYIVDPDTPNAEALLREREGKKCLLWSKYFKKIAEYRYHAGILPDGEVKVIAVQEKRKRRAYEGDIRLRNAEGYVFRTAPPEAIPEAVTECITDVMKGLQERVPHFAFAGIDVAYNRHYNEARVIEMNSAPGIGENDTRAYQEFFKQYFED